MHGRAGQSQPWVAPSAARQTGAIAGEAFRSARTRRLWLLVIGRCIVALVLTVVMQNTGLAPALLVSSRTCEV